MLYIILNLVGQKFRSSLVVWIWLRVSHEVQSDVSQGCLHLHNLLDGEFPGYPVIRTWHFHCHDLGSIPGLGNKILQVSQTGTKKKKLLLNDARESVLTFTASAGYCQENSVLQCTYSWTAWVFSSCILAGFSQKWSKGKQGRNCNAFYDLALEVTYHQVPVKHARKLFKGINIQNVDHSISHTWHFKNL